MGLIGAGFVGVGLWGLRETRRALTREHIQGPHGIGPVRTAGGAIRIFADSLWRDAGSPSRQVSATVRPTGSHA